LLDPLRKHLCILIELDSTEVFPFWYDFKGPKECKFNSHMSCTGTYNCELEHGQNHCIKGHFWQLRTNFYQVYWWPYGKIFVFLSTITLMLHWKPKWAQNLLVSLTVRVQHSALVQFWTVYSAPHIRGTYLKTFFVLRTTVMTDRFIHLTVDSYILLWLSNTTGAKFDQDVLNTNPSFHLGQFAQKNFTQFWSVAAEI